jgi:hypothetical protein
VLYCCTKEKCTFFDLILRKVMLVYSVDDYS